MVGECLDFRIFFGDSIKILHSQDNQIVTDYDYLMTKLKCVCFEHKEKKYGMVLCYYL